MSQSTAARTVRSPAVRPAVRTAEVPPRLRVVAPAPSSSRTRLVVLCLALMGGGLLALLMLNVNLSRGAYDLDAVQASNQVLIEQVQAAREDVEAQRAPQQLAARARALGMVPAPNTAFVRLADGTVIGDAKVATAPPAPKPTATAPAVQATKPSAPKATAPKATAPKATAPKPTAPKATAPKATAPKAPDQAGAKTPTAPAKP